MALVRCKECNAEISDNANICPNCGFRISWNVFHAGWRNGARIGLFLGIPISVFGGLIEPVDFFKYFAFAFLVLSGLILLWRSTVTLFKSGYIKATGYILGMLVGLFVPLLVVSAIIAFFRPSLRT